MVHLKNSTFLNKERHNLVICGIVFVSLCYQICLSKKIESEQLARQCNHCTFVDAFQSRRQQFIENLETFCCHFSFQSNWKVYPVLVV